MASVSATLLCDVTRTLSNQYQSRLRQQEHYLFRSLVVVDELYDVCAWLFSATTANSR